MRSCLDCSCKEQMVSQGGGLGGVLCQRLRFSTGTCDCLIIVIHQQVVDVTARPEDINKFMLKSLEIVLSFMLLNMSVMHFNMFPIILVLCSHKNN